jgi:hypothetical protein
MPEDRQPSESQPEAANRKPSVPGATSGDEGSSAPEQIKDREAPTSDSYGNTRDSGETKK